MKENMYAVAEYVENYIHGKDLKLYIEEDSFDHEFGTEEFKTLHSDYLEYVDVSGEGFKNCKFCMDLLLEHESIEDKVDFVIIVENDRLRISGQ